MNGLLKSSLCVIPASWSSCHGLLLLLFTQIIFSSFIMWKYVLGVFFFSQAPPTPLRPVGVYSPLHACTLLCVLGWWCMVNGLLLLCCIRLLLLLSQGFFVALSSVIICYTCRPTSIIIATTTSWCRTIFLCFLVCGIWAL